MVGVGKTTALIGLGHDKKLQEHFKDGIPFMSLGAEASVSKILGELVVIMRATGSTSSVEAVKCAPSLADAVSAGALWFQGRCSLFLIDDI